MLSTSNIVFVGGGGFERQLFDEHKLFPEPMDRDYTALGQAGEFTYGSGAYKFSVLPTRISVHHTAAAILSDQLIQAVNLVATALQGQSQGHGVTGLGINFDTVFSQSDDGLTGADFCAALSNAKKVREAIGSPYQTTQTQVIVFRGGVQYTLRLEPHGASRGANLFLGVNAHQDIIPEDDVVSRLSKANGAREYIASVVSSLSRKFEG